jgi:hypothetical protein
VLSKSEAQSLVTSYQTGLRDRIDSLLRSMASQGVVGCIFTYTSNDAPAKATPIKAELESLGWTVTIDAPNKTVTIA